MLLINEVSVRNALLDGALFVLFGTVSFVFVPSQVSGIGCVYCAYTFRDKDPFIYNCFSVNLKYYSRILNCIKLNLVIPIFTKLRIKKILRVGGD